MIGGAIVIIGVILMVIIHEGAHFIAAKSLGIKATEAFFGFGPRIWSTTRGETEYGIKAIPLGGYVRIVGMNMLEDVAPEDEGRTYREKPFWVKSVVVLAGIGSHFVVAFLLFFTIYAVLGVPTSLTTTVEAVTVTVDGVESPAFASGIQPGDRLVTVDGQNIDEWVTFVDIAQASPGETITFVVERDGELVSFESTLLARTNPDTGEETGYFGVAAASRIERIAPHTAVVESGKDIWFVAGQSLRGLWELVSNFGNILGAAVDGDAAQLGEARPVSVIGLTQLGSGITTTQGISGALYLVAWVNVFVGLLNVVPLYPLDGGHFAVAAYEKLRGKAPDVRRLIPVAAVVFIFIVALGLLGVYFDIVDPIAL